MRIGDRYAVICAAGDQWSPHELAGDVPVSAASPALPAPTAVAVMISESGSTPMVLVSVETPGPRSGAICPGRQWPAVPPQRSAERRAWCLVPEVLTQHGGQQRPGL